MYIYLQWLGSDSGSVTVYKEDYSDTLEAGQTHHLLPLPHLYK